MPPVMSPVAINSIQEVSDTVGRVQEQQGGPATRRRSAGGAGTGGAYFQAGFGETSVAVARSFGHTTSNSPLIHWLTVPGTEAFSLPWNLIGPRIVGCSFFAM